MSPPCGWRPCGRLGDETRHEATAHKLRTPGCGAAHMQSTRCAVHLILRLRSTPYAGGPKLCARATLRSRETLRWLASLRGLDSSITSITSVEHLEIAELMAGCAMHIFFGWGSMDVDAAAHPFLRRLAGLLARHTSLTLSIEAHCGLNLWFLLSRIVRHRAAPRREVGAAIAVGGRGGDEGERLAVRSRPAGMARARALRRAPTVVLALLVRRACGQRQGGRGGTGRGRRRH